MSQDATTRKEAGKPRRPWLAVVLSLLGAPVGHVYAGAPLRGVVLVAAVSAAAYGLYPLTLHLERAAALSLMGAILLGGLAILIDAYRAARRSSSHYQLRFYNRWYIYLAGIVLVSFLGEAESVAIKDHVQAFKMSSGSMLPALHGGEHVLVDRDAYRSDLPQRFDVVVFEFPEDPSKTFLKRVIGLPGETVEVRDKVVWIDERPLDDPFGRITDDRILDSRRDSMPAVKLDEQSYFLMGDNRDHSHDSRFWGPISIEKIWGRVRLIYFSWITEGSGVRWERIGTQVR